MKRPAHAYAAGGADFMKDTLTDGGLRHDPAGLSSGRTVAIGGPIKIVPFHGEPNLRKNASGVGKNREPLHKGAGMICSMVRGLPRFRLSLRPGRQNFGLTV